MTELPMGWVTTSLGEICERISDGSHNPPKKQSTGLPMLSAINITGNSIKFDSFRLISEAEFEIEDRRTKVQAEDVLLTIVGAIGRAAVVPKSARKFTLQRSVAVLRSAAMLPKLLMHHLEEPTTAEFFRENARGTAQKGVYLKTLASTPVLLPPLNEQRRIVEKIEAMFERIDKGVENLRAAKATLALYRQSLLKSAFEGRLTTDWRAQNADKLEDPKTLLARIQKERETRYKAALDDWQTALTEWRAGGEKGKKPAKPKRMKDIDPQHITLDALPESTHEWGNIRLGELNVTVSDGPFGSNLKTSDYTAAGVQVIRLENIGYGQFSAEKQSFISQEKYETISHHTVYPGTIVVSSFVTDAVRSCLVPDSVPFAINKADCFAVVLDGAQSSRKFLAYYLQSPQVFNQLEGLIHGVGRPRINTTQLKELHYPICAPAEQAEITRILEARLDAADKMEAEIDVSLTRADALRQSILKQAFAGKLVPQDPTDEPATTLLARIKTERANAPKPARTRKATA